MDAPPRLRIGVVGAGRVGAVLGAALRLAGHNCTGVSAVSDLSRLRAEALLPGVPVKPADQVVAESELVILAVPDSVLPDLIRGFLAEQKTVIRSPHSIRPWQHVLDPLNGYLTVASTLIAGKQISPAFNFGPGDESKLTVQQMAEYACAQWQGSQGIDVIEDKNALPESGLLWLSSNLAIQELGWRNRFEAKEAIRWTIEWERESMNSTPLQALDRQIKAFFGAE